MKNLKTILLSISILFCTISQAADDRPFNSVQKLFAAISAFNYSEMKAAATDDFQLLEAGEVWDMAMLINAVKPKDKPYKRRNYFSLINVVSKNEVVWISYWNKASFITESKTSEAAWLESVVIVKIGNSWKVQLMHSTRVKSKDLPPEVKFIEYVAKPSIN